MTLETAVLFQTLLLLSFKAAMLVLAIMLLRAFFGKRLSPAWRHAIWGLVPLQLLICFSVPSILSVYNFFPQRVTLLEKTSQPSQMPEELQVLPFDMAVSQPLTEPVVEEPNGAFELPPPVVADTIPEISPEPVSVDMTPIVTAETEPMFWHGLMAVWLAGCGVMCLVFARQFLLCRRWMRQAEHVENEAVLHLFKECAKRMRIRTWLVIAESRSVSGPLLIGAIRPTLLLPSHLVKSATPEQLQTVFLHELAHLKRWDVWTGWLMTVLLTLHWFNPLLWLAVRKMNADREEACDALALESLDPAERPNYGYALIDIAQHFVTPARTPGLVGISETGKHLKRRIEMIKRTGTYSLRWKILALFAVLFIGVATMTDAQDRTPKRSAAEIQAEIDRLQAELAQAKADAEAEKKTEEPKTEQEPKEINSDLAISPSRIIKVTANALVEKLPGRYLGTEGDDRFGIEIFEDINGTFPITFYEDGLPGNGYDPKDDDKYVGTASLGFGISSPNQPGGFFADDDPEITSAGLVIELSRKYDGRKEKRIEKVFQRPLRAKIEFDPKNFDAPLKIVIAKNEEWDEIRVSQIASAIQLIPSEEIPGIVSGGYIGWEGDDRIGVQLNFMDKRQNKEKPEFEIMIFENGFDGYDPTDDDRYEGTAVFSNGKLDITLTKKFDDGREEPVEKALQKLTANVFRSKTEVRITIDKNSEWDAVEVVKSLPVSRSSFEQRRRGPVNPGAPNR